MIEAPEVERMGDRIVELTDERTDLAGEALELIGQVFPAHQRQPLEQIGMEIAEKRLGLLTSYDFHLFAAVDADDRVFGVSAGVYLGGVNAGFVTYLAVHPEYRARKIGRRLRVRLVEAFRADARQLEWEEPNWVVGEVRQDNPWLARLVRERSVIPFDLRYLHPGLDTASTDRWILYRQPIADHRQEIPVGEVKKLVYAIWRRAYRVRWPLERPAFRAMLEELEARQSVGPHPDFAG